MKRPSFMTRWMVFFTVIAAGCGSPEDKADRLFIEASTLFRQARESEETSYSEAGSLYKEAETRLEQIRSRYPSSSVADKLDRSEVRIDGHTYQEFKKTILPRAALRSDAERSPLACALLTARQIKSTSLRERQLARIAIRYAEIDHFDRALRIVDRIEDKETKAETLAVIGGRVAKIGQPVGASEVLAQSLQAAEDITDPPSKDEAMAVIAVQFAKSFQYEQALAMADSIEDAGSREEALAGIAAALAGTGQFDRAIQIVDTIENVRRRVEALTGIVGRYPEARQIDRAFRIAKTVDYFKTSALAGIAGKFAEAGRYEKALQTAEQIGNAEDRATALVWIAELRGTAGDKEKATETLSRALQEAERIVRPGDRASMLIWIAGTYSENGQRETASKILYDALEIVRGIKYFRTSMLRMVADGFAEAGRFDLAMQVVDGIDEVDSKAIALADMAGRYRKFGREKDVAECLDRALLEAQIIKDSASRSEALSGICREYAESGFYEQALEIAGSIDAEETRARTLISIASLYMKTGQRGEVLKVLARSLETAEKIGDDFGRAQTMASVAGKHIRIGSRRTAAEILSRAYRIVEGVKDDYSKATGLAGIAYLFADAGRREQADAALDEAIRIARTMEDDDAAAKLLVDISERAMEAGRYDEVGGLLSLALEIAEGVKDGYSRVLLWVRMADQTMRTGADEAALKMLTRASDDIKTIPNEPARARASAEVAVHWAQAGRYERALEIAKTITGYDIKLLVGMASEYTGAGRIDQAEELLDRALSMTGSVERPVDRASALAKIAGGFLDAGEQDKALEVLDDALHATDSIPHGPDRDQTLAEVTVRTAESGQFDRALTLIDSMEDVDYRASAATGIALCLEETKGPSDDHRHALLHALVRGIDGEARIKTP